MADDKMRTWPLKAVPEDVRKTVLDEQARLKKECNCQKSIQSTIYSIIRKFGKQGGEP